jgi:hypothetical protein
MLWTAKMLVPYRRTAAKKASHFVIFVAFAALGEPPALTCDVLIRSTVESLGGRSTEIGNTKVSFIRLSEPRESLTA